VPILVRKAEAVNQIVAVRAAHRGGILFDAG
jgi:hypothetical protein